MINRIKEKPNIWNYIDWDLFSISMNKIYTHHKQIIQIIYRMFSVNQIL